MCEVVQFAADRSDRAAGANCTEDCACYFGSNCSIAARRNVILALRWGSDCK
jgi:hypothetical protein